MPTRDDALVLWQPPTEVGFLQSLAFHDPSQCLHRRQPNNRYVQRVYNAGMYKGLPISINKVILFHKLQCYMFHKTGNDCRSTGGRIAKAYALPRNIPPPSPPWVPKKKCRKCKREWSLSRFIDLRQRSGTRPGMRILSRI
jgi:hypothetical protein